MPPVIDCCIDGLDRETLAALHESEATVNVQHCLGRCGICYHEPFLVADGVVRSGDDLTAALEETIG